MRKSITVLAALLALLIVAVAPGFAQDGEEQTIAEIAGGNEDFSTLMTAVGAADPAIAEALSGEGELTVFAPTNEAFAETFSKLGLSPEDVVSNQELLTTILQYHVLDGAVMSESVVELGDAEVETLQGEPINVRVSGGNVTINQANLIDLDIEASNGVIHVIDEVLLPESVLRSLIADEELGTEDDPITLLFIPSEDAQNVAVGADDLAELVSEQSGFEVEARVSTDYAAAIEALCGEEAEIGALNTFGYILASQRDCATVGVVSVRFGSNFYAGQIIVPADSSIESLADIDSEVTFCRPDPLSTSGWIVPSIAMRAAGIDLDTLNVVDAGGHDGVVAGVYNGECDAGATYVDARDTIEEESPDVFDRVAVIGESAPIPNDTLSYGNHVPYAMQLILTEALLEIASDEANAELLDAVYSWDALQRASDSFFNDFREQLDAAGVDVEELQ
jgi:phosphonate transport system substrate-binding protein